MTGRKLERHPGRSRGLVLDGAVLKRLRAELGWTQEAVAERAGITTRSYQNAEAGQRVSSQLAQAVTAALGQPLSCLVRAEATKISQRLLEIGCAPLPPPVPWVSREKETAELVEALGNDTPGPCMCLCGPTGMGKTALACQAAQALGETFADGVVWVSASRNASEQNAASTMARIARALGFEHRLPPSGQVAYEAYRNAFLAALWDRRRLLVLDDVSCVADAERFLSREVSGWTLLTTTSERVATEYGRPQQRIGPLSQSSSLRLLCAHLGEARVAAETDEARSLVDRLGNVPENLLIAASTLQAESFVSIAEYARRIQALDDDAPVLQGDWLLARDEASFVSSYARLAQQLGARSWRFFASLSTFRGLPFSAQWAAAVAETSPEEAGCHLSVLADVQLVRTAALHEAGAPAFALDAQAYRVARACFARRSDSQRHSERQARGESQRVRKPLQASGPDQLARRRHRDSGHRFEEQWLQTGSEASR